MGKNKTETNNGKDNGDRSEDFILRPREDRGTQTRAFYKNSLKEKRASDKRRKDIERTRVRVARLSVASNAILLVLKLIFGFLMGSISVISEGIHSGMDLLAAVIAMMAVARSMRPADEDHKYGHGKYEPISGTLEAILIFIAAVLIIYESALKLVYGSKVEMIEGGILIMLLSVILNTVVSRTLMKVAKETDSLALEADALHLSTDVMTSAGVLAGLVIIRITNLMILDPIVAILVAMLIIKAAYDLTKKTIVDLTDTRIPEGEEKAIIEVLDAHDHAIHDYHDLRTRRSGQNRYIDLHIVVSRDLGLVETHRLCDHIEAEIRKRLDHSNVLIHCEPCDGRCEHCDEEEVCVELRREKLEKLKRSKIAAAKRRGEPVDEEGPQDGDYEPLTKLEKRQVEEKVTHILRKFEEVVSYHRIDPRRKGENLLLTLHVLVKAELTVERTHEIDHALRDSLRQIYPDMEVVAHMEPCDGECKTCEENDCPERSDG